MNRKALLVTNNAKAQAAYQDHPLLAVDYLAGGDYLAVLLRTRDHIHRGARLLSHPQASNLKPNQTPYKTVLLAPCPGARPLARDIALMESALAAYEKFTRGMTPPRWPERTLADFETVDLAVAQSAIQRLSDWTAEFDGGFGGFELACANHASGDAITKTGGVQDK